MRKEKTNSRMTIEESPAMMSPMTCLIGRGSRSLNMPGSKYSLRDCARGAGSVGDLPVPAREVGRRTQSRRRRHNMLARMAELPFRQE
jgi:hypothetical protein